MQKGTGNTRAPVTVSLGYLWYGVIQIPLQNKVPTKTVTKQGSKLRLTGRQCDQKLSAGD